MRVAWGREHDAQLRGEEARLGVMVVDLKEAGGALRPATAQHHWSRHSEAARWLGAAGGSADRARHASADAPGGGGDDEASSLMALFSNTIPANHRSDRAMPWERLGDGGPQAIHCVAEPNLKTTEEPIASTFDAGLREPSIMSNNDHTTRMYVITAM